MKDTTQDLLLADRLLALAEVLKNRESEVQFPDGSNALARETTEARKQWVSRQPDEKHVRLALLKLEEVAAIVSPLP